MTFCKVYFLKCFDRQTSNPEASLGQGPYLFFSLFFSFSYPLPPPLPSPPPSLYCYHYLPCLFVCFFTPPVQCPAQRLVIESHLLRVCEYIRLDKRRRVDKRPFSKPHQQRLAFQRLGRKEKCSPLCLTELQCWVISGKWVVNCVRKQETEVLVRTLSLLCDFGQVVDLPWLFLLLHL